MAGLHSAEASRMSLSVASQMGERPRPEILGREAMSRACERAEVGVLVCQKGLQLFF